MNKYLIGFMLMLSINCTAQDNRFSKSFSEANVAFTENQNRKVFDSIDSLITDRETEKEITVTVEMLLLLYRIGYIDGSLSAMEKKGIDFEMLKANITANIKSIESYQRFLKLNNKKS